MNEERPTGHLAPEVFVDVLEGTPVDASWRQHLEACDACQVELHELDQTLATLRTDVDIPASTTPAPTRMRLLPAWLASVAAAVIVAVGVGYWMSGDSEPAATDSAGVEELLPSVDDDEEFQLLLALSGALEEAELLEVDGLASILVVDDASLDPDRLTPEEQQRFVERLTEEMRSSL